MIQTFFLHKVVLSIRCAKCKCKLFKYHKIGQGKVLKCHKERILPLNFIEEDGKMYCPCTNLIGIDKGSFYQMKQGQFVYSGTKDFT
jgi:hypothetical protein